MSETTSGNDCGQNALRLLFALAPALLSFGFAEDWPHTLGLLLESVPIRISSARARDQLSLKKIPAHYRERNVMQKAVAPENKGTDVQVST